MSDYLIHHGIKGQKWGIRRYQNPDGTRTAEGKKRYSDDAKPIKEKPRLTDKQKTTIKVGATAAGVALAAYGGYKLSKYLSNPAIKSMAANGKKLVDSHAELLAKADKDATKNALKNEYLMKNIANIQSHIDPTTAVRNSEKYQHAYYSTLNSRIGSIKGDRKLYGEKAVEGRDAAKEAKNFVDNALAYQMHRGGMYGYGWKGDIEKQTAAVIQERVNKMTLLNKSMSSITNNTELEDYTAQLLKKTRS